MGIPTTTTSKPASEKQTGSRVEGAGIPMKGEMSKKFEEALNNFKDIYGNESGDDNSEEPDDTNGTGIKLHPMPHL